VVTDVCITAWGAPPRVVRESLTGHIVMELLGHLASKVKEVVSTITTAMIVTVFPLAVGGGTTR